jgi:serine/threonine protein kinase
MGGLIVKEMWDSMRFPFHKYEGVPTEKLMTKLRGPNDYLTHDLSKLHNNGGKVSVVKVSCRRIRLSYAMKIFDYNFLDPDIDRAEKEEVFREIDNLRELDHLNIAKIEVLVLKNNKTGVDGKELCLCDNSPVLVMELCEGSLQDFINQNKGKQIPEKDILFIFA